MLRCKYCGAEGRKDGRPFEKQGQLNLHEYHCKMRHTGEAEQEKCKHEFRFLNVKSAIEKKAYDAGYMEVCIKCQELH